MSKNVNNLRPIGTYPVRTNINGYILVKKIHLISNFITNFTHRYYTTTTYSSLDNALRTHTH